MAPDLPPPAPVELADLSGEDLAAFFKKRPARKAGGLDFWTTHECKQLPAPVYDLDFEGSDMLKDWRIKDSVAEASRYSKGPRELTTGGLEAERLGW